MRRPSSGRATRPGRRGPAADARTVAAWAGAAFIGSVPALFAVGQVAVDRWAWSQWLFWIPAWVAGPLALAALAAVRRWTPVGGARRAATVALAALAALAGWRFLANDVGWRPFASPSSGGVSVAHWNPQWPGQDSMAAGRAFAPLLGDVSVLTSPGSMLRSPVAGTWVPDGLACVDLGLVGIVSRLPVLDARLLLVGEVAPGWRYWLAWFEVRLPNDDPFALLVVDLPSNPLLPRSEVAAALAHAVDAAVPRTPDVILGDLNTLPGSVVFAALPEGARAAPAWRSSGWLATYPRPWAWVRIDSMLADRRWEWVRYATHDLGMRRHRAQRGEFLRSERNAVAGSVADG